MNRKKLSAGNQDQIILLFQNTFGKLNNNNNVYFKLVYRLIDNNICTNHGHGIKAVIYYIFTITDTSLRTRKSSDCIN